MQPALHHTCARGKHRREFNDTKTNGESTENDESRGDEGEQGERHVLSAYFLEGSAEKFRMFV